MTHEMKLNDEPFSCIENHKKTIELRLYDDKRKKVHIDDIIIFTNINDSSKRIKTQVTALHIYKDFSELYSRLPKDKIGYENDEIADPNDMDHYYSKEQQNKYGVVGIEFIILK